MKEFIEAFKALRHAPLAFWLCVFAFTFDGMAYFGVLPLMKPFLGQDLLIKPEYASIWVSCFTGSLTIAMLLVGASERVLGIRKSLILALTLSTLGRVVYSSSPFFGGLFGLAVSLVIIATGEATVQVICYAGVKRYTTEKTSSMGYALLYAGLNFGAMLTGPLSAKVRTTQDVAYKAGTSALSGFNAVNWVCTGITAATLLVFFLFMSKKVEANVARGTDEPKEKAIAGDRGSAKEPPAKPAGKSPFKDPRFLFFIFALLPVRTLFAHQWLTMPEYVLRSYSQDVADHMEVFVDSVNPLVIFFGVPTIAALTKKRHVLSMMIVGSLVSASATFILCAGEHVTLLLLYFVVFSIGEAIWSSRFLEYAAEIAPEGRVAQYMGVANLPWFVAKTTTGFYSGFILEKFVPKDGAKSGPTMWLIYGAIAMLSPLALTTARKWLRAGMVVKAPAAEPS
ncbi:MAG: MFS transporter [Labilithrix sp.]|nr:MFS transporter [Labilithrix sp.]MCW5813439.1 MFS transporter [Labilithrix sp.]